MSTRCEGRLWGCAADWGCGEVGAADWSVCTHGAVMDGVGDEMLCVFVWKITQPRPRPAVRAVVIAIQLVNAGDSQQHSLQIKFTVSRKRIGGVLCASGEWHA